MQKLNCSHANCKMLNVNYVLHFSPVRHANCKMLKVMFYLLIAFSLVRHANCNMLKVKC